MYTQESKTRNGLPRGSVILGELTLALRYFSLISWMPVYFSRKLSVSPQSLCMQKKNIFRNGSIFQKYCSLLMHKGYYC